MAYFNSAGGSWRWRVADVAENFYVGRRRNNVAVVQLYYHHHHDSPPNPIWGTTSHGQILCQSREMIKHVVPSLLGIVLLKYQGNPGALFAGYPALAVWCFILSHCAYWALLSKVKPQMPDTKYLGVLIHAALGYGLISALSLLSVLLPHQIWALALLLFFNVLALPQAGNWEALKLTTWNL